MRKLILGTASVLALGIGGAALDFSADADNPVSKAESDTTPSAGASHGLDAPTLWKDDVRWAQLELRNQGLYKGSLDGMIGPETKRALAQFQQYNGLNQSATLDQETFDALTENLTIGQGSSIPPNSQRINSIKNLSGARNSSE